MPLTEEEIKDAENNAKIAISKFIQQDVSMISKELHDSMSSYFFATGVLFALTGKIPTQDNLQQWKEEGLALIK